MPPGHRAVRHRAAGNPFHGTNHLEHRVANAIAQVPDNLVPFVQFDECQKVGLCEIRHVDIVPDTAAVLRIIVRTEHTQHRTPSQDGINRERNQVRLRAVILAKTAIRFGSGRVEITKTGGS